MAATGVAHLRVRSWICDSQLYAPRRTVAVRGQATVVEADIVRRLPATVVRIAHPAAAALRPMGAEAVVGITAAEVEADTAAEAVVGTPAAAEVVGVTQAVAAATPVEVIAKSS